MQRRSQLSSLIVTTVLGGEVDMINEAELRAEIGRAVRGESSLHDLYHWLMARSWNMHKDSSESAIELAAEVEGLFFARSDGELSDAQVLAGLVLLNPASQHVFLDANVLLTSDPSVTIALPVEYALAMAPDIAWSNDRSTVTISAGTLIFDARSISANSAYGAVESPIRKRPYRASGQMAQPPKRQLAEVA